MEWSLQLKRNFVFPSRCGRTAFTHNYLSELSLWRDVRSSSTNGNCCRRNFYSGFSVCFLVPVWSSCSFHCKTELGRVPPNIYVWNVISNWKETLCSQKARWRTAFTHKYLSELSMWKDLRSSITKGTCCRRNYLWYLSVFPSAGLQFLQFSQ